MLIACLAVSRPAWRRTRSREGMRVLVIDPDPAGLEIRGTQVADQDALRWKRRSRRGR